MRTSPPPSFSQNTSNQQSPFPDSNPMKRSTDKPGRILLSHENDSSQGESSLVLTTSHASGGSLPPSISVLPDCETQGFQISDPNFVLSLPPSFLATPNSRVSTYFHLPYTSQPRFLFTYASVYLYFCPPLSLHWCWCSQLIFRLLFLYRATCIAFLWRVTPMCSGSVHIDEGCNGVRHAKVQSR